jgi:hypothetical protein
MLLGSIVLAAAVLAAWFPGRALIGQRSSLAADASQLASLHSQDAALTQEQRNLSDTGEIGRIAREQYQLVSPGQQAYEVLPPPGGATGAASPSTGDPGSAGPVAPSATAELPPAGVTTTTAPGSPATHAASRSGSGMLSRMLRALEFWR